MEILGIILSIPAAFVASTVYSFLISKFVIRIDPLRRVMWMASVGVLILFVIEVALLIAIGAVPSREILGPAFYVAHVVVFFAGPPALANVLILRNSRRALRWYWAVPACTAFAFVLVLLQYGVTEALYGID